MTAAKRSFLICHLLTVPVFLFRFSYCLTLTVYCTSPPFGTDLLDRKNGVNLASIQKTYILVFYQSLGKPASPPSPNHLWPHLLPPWIRGPQLRCTPRHCRSSSTDDHLTAPSSCSITPSLTFNSTVRLFLRYHSCRRAYQFCPPVHFCT